MFSKPSMPIRNDGHEAETVIAASVKVEGEFASQGNVLIEGCVEGSLKTERDLRVGEKARIAADVVAANAVVAGEIRGNITVSEKLELEPTAHIHGDVRTKVLVVATGAEINGRISMGAETETADKRVRIAAKTADKPAAAPAETPSEADKQAAKILFGR